LSNNYVKTFDEEPEWVSTPTKLDLVLLEDDNYSLFRFDYHGRPRFHFDWDDGMNMWPGLFLLQEN